MNNKLGFLSNGLGYVLAIGIIITIAVLSNVNSSSIISNISVTTTTIIITDTTLKNTTTTKSKIKTTTTTTKEDLSWCKKGEIILIQDKGVSTKISEIEKLTVAGVKMNLCCSYGKLTVQADTGSIDNFKACFNQTGYGIQYLYKESTKTYRKISESYPKDGKTCVRLFGLDGKAGEEICLNIKK